MMLFLGQLTWIGLDGVAIGTLFAVPGGAELVVTGGVYVVTGAADGVPELMMVVVEPPVTVLMMIVLVVPPQAAQARPTAMNTAISRALITALDASRSTP